MDNDVSYFTRRASQERSAAANAASREAEQAHLELAARYEDLSHRAGRTGRRAAVRLVQQAALRGS
jgi:hypothetical protein